MGFFSKITRPFKKAANKVIKPFQKVSDKLIPNELRPLLPYASMFIPGSGILSGLGGAGRFASMYGTNMLTQAMADPEADFEDLNQLSGILSGGQGYLSGASAAGDLRNMQSPEMQSYKQALNLNETGGQMIKPTAMTGLNNRSILSKVGDLGLEGLAKGSEYLTGNNKILQDVGSGRVDLFDIENAKAAAKAIAPNFAQATGDVAVNYQAADAAEIEATTTASDLDRAYYSMRFNREAGNDEDIVLETLTDNGLQEFYVAPGEDAYVPDSEQEETAAYGGLMGRSDYEFGGITEALNNAGARGLMTENNDMGGIMNGYNMGGSVLPQGMEMDYRQGGFIPMGSKERADDVPARVSKNEFVMTADAVRAAGGGSVNEGAKKMYEIMNNLEARA